MARPGTVRERWRRLPALLAAVVVVLLAAGCVTEPSPPPASAGTGIDAPGPAEITAGAADRLPPGRPGTGKPPIVIGTKDFAEPFLLGELYTQALQAKGYDVQLEQNIGPSEIMDTAFATGQIQMYPEYLGVIATVIAPESGMDRGPNTPLGAYRTAKRFVEAERGGTVLKQTPYQNVDVLIVKRELAERYGLRSVPDLARLGPGFRLAAQPAFRTRDTGLPGMARVYGLDDISFLAVTPGSTYEALDGGLVDVADGFSTDAQLRAGDYVALDDPLDVFGFGYAAPVVKQDSLTQMGPEFARTCNWVSSLLTVDAIRAMNEQVQTGGASEDEVVRAFLASRGLR